MRTHSPSKMLETIVFYVKYFNIFTQHQGLDVVYIILKITYFVNSFMTL